MPARIQLVKQQHNGCANHGDVLPLHSFPFVAISPQEETLPLYVLL